MTTDAPDHHDATAGSALPPAARRPAVPGLPLARSHAGSHARSRHGEQVDVVQVDVVQVDVVLVAQDAADWIGQTLSALTGFGARFLLDDGSTDATCALAAAAGFEIVPFAWHADADDPIAWGLRHLPLQADWVLCLNDAVVVDHRLAAEIAQTARTAPAAAGAFDITVTGRRAPWRRLWRRPVRQAVMRRSLLRWGPGGSPQPGGETCRLTNPLVEVPADGLSRRPAS